ncbi:hypothetical protein [Catenuloplanes japonicus]|uniref:hypothetical protein n=1 Tax=Catenuloplanes japonicus TaxID=33876 RepID=UPI00068AE8C2|nr:hypothetical protein [Catenuloplanes japonicus]
MEVWSHGGKLYDVTSGYSLPDDAWQYELMGLTGAPGTGPYLSVSIPDATLDGPFTPRTTQHVVVHLGGGELPWPILEKLIFLLESSGDLVEDHNEQSTAELASLPVRGIWSIGSRRFEVADSHHSDTGVQLYELHEVSPETADGNYISVQISDASTESQPPVGHATLTMYGRWAIPWLVFRRFVDVVRTAGNVKQVASEGALRTDQL